MHARRRTPGAGWGRGRRRTRRLGRTPPGRGWPRRAAPRSSAPRSTTTSPTSTSLGGGALEQLQRRVEAQHLLDASARTSAPGRSPRRSSATSPLPNTLTDASWPALSSSTTAATTSSSVSVGRPTRSLIRSSAGPRRRSATSSRTSRRTRWRPRTAASTTCCGRRDLVHPHDRLRPAPQRRARRSAARRAARRSPAPAAARRTSAITSKPSGSTSSSSVAASSRTRGRSRSTWPRANAAATGRRSRVCSGGSFSIIWLRCSRLNGSRYVRPAPCRCQIRPSRRSRSTCADRRVVEGQAHPGRLVPGDRVPRPLLGEERVGVGDDLRPTVRSSEVVPSGPNASGSTSFIGRTPETVISSRSGPPFS